MVQRGDVVLVDFPLQPGQPPKRRPGVVVQSDRNNTRLANTIVVMITSNTRLASQEPAQVLISLTTPDGRRSGLTRDSAVKCENLYTVPTASVRRTIGRLSKSLLRQVDDALKASLDLP